MQKHFLDAARKVFATRGFAEATVTEVVEEAGGSVGSLYHHFGSKTDLFIALWERHNSELYVVTAAAVSRARAVGVTDAYDLFVTGSRAYLDAIWVRRDLVKVFNVGDTPPGFRSRQREGGRSWMASNFKLLDADDEAVQRALVYVATSFLDEASREIASAATAKRARELVPTMVGIIERMRPLFTPRLADAAID